MSLYGLNTKPVIGTAVAVGDGEGVGVAVCVGVAVGVGVAVRTGVAVGVSVGNCVAVGVAPQLPIVCQTSHWPESDGLSPCVHHFA